MSKTKETLDQRGVSYGTYHTGANLTQALHGILMKHHSNVHAEDENAKPLPPFIAESIHMICGKLSRAVNGDPFFVDSWRDISGYALLVAETLNGVDGATDVQVTQLRNDKGAWVIADATTAQEEPIITTAQEEPDTLMQEGE